MKRYPADIVEKLIVQEGKCVYCGFPMPLQTADPALEVSRDHFIPKSKGGKKKRNLVLCHAACNQNKADKMPTVEQTQKYEQVRHFLRAHRKQIDAFYNSLKKEKNHV